MNSNSVTDLERLELDETKWETLLHEIARVTARRDRMREESGNLLDSTRVRHQ